MSGCHSIKSTASQFHAAQVFDSSRLDFYKLLTITPPDRHSFATKKMDSLSNPGRSFYIVAY